MHVAVTMMVQQGACINKVTGLQRSASKLRAMHDTIEG
jgi:hypothetical protein